MYVIAKSDLDGSIMTSERGVCSLNKIQQRQKIWGGRCRESTVTEPHLFAFLLTTQPLTFLLLISSFLFSTSHRTSSPPLEPLWLYEWVLLPLVFISSSLPKFPTFLLTRLSLPGHSQKLARWGARELTKAPFIIKPRWSQQRTGWGGFVTERADFRHGFQSLAGRMIPESTPYTGRNVLHPLSGKTKARSLVSALVPRPTLILRLLLTHDVLHPFFSIYSKTISKISELSTQ